MFKVEFSSLMLVWEDLRNTVDIHHDAITLGKKNAD